MHQNRSCHEPQLSSTRSRRPRCADRFAASFFFTYLSRGSFSHTNLIPSLFSPYGSLFFSFFFFRVFEFLFVEYFVTLFGMRGPFHVYILSKVCFYSCLSGVVLCFCHNLIAKAPLSFLIICFFFGINVPSLHLIFIFYVRVGMEA